MTGWHYQCPCGILQPHDDSEADIKTCGHSNFFNVCLCHSD